MPELPEVETVARQLAPLLEGRRVMRLRLLDPLLRNGSIPRVAGRKIEGVSRSGKRVLIRFDEGASRRRLWLAVHLRMTGRLIWDGSGPAPRDHLRARFVLDRGALLFIDTRRFGTFHWYRSERAAAPEGVEPLGRELSTDRLSQLLGDSRQPIKPWLLRQDKVVGIGNIYASEILHAAAISPFREAGSLDRRETRRLRDRTRSILERAIRNCGTTFSDFQDARGVEGSYQQFLKVYDREGQRCRRCRGAIERRVQQQRSTFYCPSCQH